jgi:REP element-mobilizing transposase RayT
MKNLIYADLPAAYRLHYHVRFQTKNQRPLFNPNQFDSILGGLQQICDQHDYHLLESKPEAHQLRCLLSLRPKQAPSKVMQIVKTNLSRQLRQSLSDLEAPASPVWQRGFYVRTAGKIDRRAVERYVEAQDAHHGYSSRLHRPVAK